ncbi:MAG: sulfite exporter TauE/SafE family protein, partial [Candidatus Baltobacteraceae bacterium]
MFATGLGASIFGSMVGLGGGFIAVPILLLFFGLPPAQAAGTSLSLVVANSAAGAVTYSLQDRVHVRIGLLIAIGGIPGSILGALLAQRVSPALFDWALAVLLVGVSIDMTFNRRKRLANRNAAALQQHAMRWEKWLLLGVFVGFVSSLFGIGGGMVVVPSLLYFSALPAHMI